MQRKVKIPVYARIVESRGVVVHEKVTIKPTCKVRFVRKGF